MSATVEQTTVAISLHGGCDYPSCSELAFRIHHQLSVPKYTTGMSVMPNPESLEEWQAQHRTARKRSWRAERLGYTFDAIDRAVFNDDIHEINTSKQERQGRPMDAGYMRRHNHGSLPAYPCDLHRTHTYGIIKAERLRAYLSMYRVGDLLMVSMILGHGDHLRDDIMYLLMAGAIGEHAGTGGYWFYNRHDSGTEGLVYFKERIGLHPSDIEWSLA